jgi:hypothetical protein
MIRDRGLIDVRARIGAVAWIRGPRRKNDYREKGGRGWTGDPGLIDERTPGPVVPRQGRSPYARFGPALAPRQTRRADHSSRVSSAGSFANVGRDAPRLVFREHFRLDRFGFIRPAVDVSERLAVGIAHDVATGHLFDAPRRGETARRHAAYHYTAPGPLRRLCISLLVLK